MARRSLPAGYPGRGEKAGRSSGATDALPLVSNQQPSKRHAERRQDAMLFLAINLAKFTYFHPNTKKIQTQAEIYRTSLQPVFAEWFLLFL